MCGLCGILDLGSATPDRDAVLGEMMARLRHRGPDGAGMWKEGPVALGHRRLSIIDIAGGDQPMPNEDRSVWTVFNGEIYNFQELTRRLRSAGHEFRTNCDTEVVVHAYEEWGVDCLRHLRGMFGFALWDGTRKRLLLARDRLGIKPLYYSIVPDRHVVFGSEIKALLAHPTVSRSLDPVALDQYLSLQYVPGPRTGFQGIRKLAPGHAMLVADGRVQTVEYWNPVDRVVHDSRPVTGEELRSVLRDAVETHLVSDVPVGSFLSGGIDSGIVTALMAECIRDDPVAVTVGFREEGIDESRLAGRVAERYSCDHRIHHLDVDVAEVFDRCVGYLDEPFGDWSALPTYVVSEAARSEVKVVLSGDGGDELFGGYTRHRVQRYEAAARRLSDRLPAPVRKVFADMYPSGLKGSTTIHDLLHPFAHSVARKHAHGFFPGAGQRRAVRGERLREGLRGEEGAEPYEKRFERLFEPVRDWDPLSAALYMELRTYLVDDILQKVDAMSMAHSLEVRVPLLDHRVVETALRIPARRKVGWRRGKLVLRETFDGLLPPDIWRQPKRGFDIPAAQWLRTCLKERAEDLLLSRQSREGGLTDPETVSELWRQHQEGEADHARRLWALLMLEAWRRKVENGNDDVAAVPPRRPEHAAPGG